MDDAREFRKAFAQVGDIMNISIHKLQRKTNYKLKKLHSIGIHFTNHYGKSAVTVE